MRGVVGLAWLLALAACSGPPAGSEIRAVVMRPVTPAMMAGNAAYRSAAERAREAATGLAALAGQGRVVAVRCAVSPVEVVFHQAVLPVGMTVAEGDLLRVRLGDAGTVDAVVGRVDEPPGLTEGVLREVAPGREAFVARHYYPVRRAYVLRCAAGG